MNAWKTHFLDILTIEFLHINSIAICNYRSVAFFFISLFLNPKFVIWEKIKSLKCVESKEWNKLWQTKHGQRHGCMGQTDRSDKGVGGRWKGKEDVSQRTYMHLCLNPWTQAAMWRMPGMEAVRAGCRGEGGTFTIVSTTTKIEGNGWHSSAVKWDIFPMLFK